MEHTPCRFRDDQSGEDMLRLFLRLLPTINARQLAWFRADLQGGMLRISPPGRELRQSALRSQTDCTQIASPELLDEGVADRQPTLAGKGPFIILQRKTILVFPECFANLEVRT